MTDQLGVLLEIGPKGKRIVASAMDWPGLERWGRTEDEAIDRLFAYLPRYAPVAKRVGLGKEFERGVQPHIIERTPGNSSTDWWGIAHVPSAVEADPLTDDELERRVGIMRATWAFFDDASNGVSPQSLTTRQAYDLLADGFGPGFNGPLLLVADLGDASVDDLDALRTAVDADPGVQAVAPVVPNDEGTAAVLRVIPDTSPQDERTSDLVHRLRSDVIPEATAGTGAQVYVGGQTATFIDMSDKVADRLPYFVGAVIVLSVVLLMMVFRSVAVPLKAAAMNLLSIGAAYGVIVAVFQWGWMKGLFGVAETVPIVSFMPMMLFAILFGLSMDYEVFLLTRVREEYLHRRDNTTAVIEGISATARVITSAALIMISVFAAFVLGDDPMIKMFGLGLATAVFIDATIVRIVLVPATMRLLGDWNWWLPGWLDRLLPNLDVEGGVGLPEPEFEPGRGPVPTPGVTPEPALTS